MTDFSKVFAAEICLLLTLAIRARCHPGQLYSQQQLQARQANPATSYSYFSLSVPKDHLAPAAAPTPLYLSHTPITQDEDVAGADSYGHEQAIFAEPKYQFKYGVEDQHTGDYKSAREERHGDVVEGEYSVLQPDGRTRTVHYTASKHGGFNAVVSYSGYAFDQEQHNQIDY